MNDSNTTLCFDSSDCKGMLKLMEQYGDNPDGPFEGKNKDGETILISINKSNITTRTLQHNGWMRINSYTYDDGDWIREELFAR